MAKRPIRIDLSVRTLVEHSATLPRMRVARTADTLVEPLFSSVGDAACTGIPRACAEPADFVVLASSSSGNCSALIHGEGKLRRVTLIDAGLSPLRTRRTLASFGLTLDHIDDVLITHLDADHFNPSWIRALPRRTRLHLHALHAPRARREGLPIERFQTYTEPMTLRSGAIAHPLVMSHDAWGVVVFRIDLGTESLGYATDVGQTSPELTGAMAGVDVLAIESNYCPDLLHASDRPDFLKHRISGGAGHLSNHQCAQTVRKAAPRRHVVLLHLSRQCNTPEAASAPHAGAPYALTVAHDREPTRPLRVGA